ncbi:tetratricopeptide repeat protein [Thermodesulfobacteriota bacterium]
MTNLLLSPSLEEAVSFKNWIIFINVPKEIRRFSAEPIETLVLPDLQRYRFADFPKDVVFLDLSRRSLGALEDILKRYIIRDYLANDDYEDLHALILQRHQQDHPDQDIFLKHYACELERNWERFLKPVDPMIELHTGLLTQCYNTIFEAIRGRSIIDIGSGKCFLPFFLKRVRPELEITSTDVSLEVMVNAEKFCRRDGCNIHFAEVDILDPQDPPMADTVMSCHVFEHIYDHEALLFLQNCIRMARKRVIVIAPFEKELSSRAHKQLLNEIKMKELARACGYPFHIFPINGDAYSGNECLIIDVDEGAQAGDYQGIHVLLTEAHRLESLGHISDAEEIFERIVQQYGQPGRPGNELVPRHVRQHYGMQRTGRLQDLLTKMIDSKPDLLEARLQLALHHLSHGRECNDKHEILLATKLFEGILDLWPDSPITLDRIGAHYLFMGDPRAGKFYKRLSDEYSWLDYGWIGLGRSLLRTGQTEEAAKVFEKCTSLPPTNLTETLNFKGELELAEGKVEAAVGSFERAWSGDADSAYILCPQLIEASSSRKSIIDELKDQTKKTKASLWIWYNLARLYKEDRRYSEAIEAYSEVLDIDPQTAPALRGRGECLFGLRKTNAAIEDLNRALALDPELDWAWFSLGKCLLADMKVEQAGEAFQHSIEVGRGWNEEPHAWIGVGKCNLKTGDIKTAVEALQKAMSLDSDLPEILNFRGELELAEGKVEAAVGSFKRAWSGDADSASLLCPQLIEASSSRKSIIDELKDQTKKTKASLWIWYNLARLYKEDRRYSEAIEAYSEVLDIDPQTAPALRDRGECLFELRKTNAAIEDLNRALALDPELDWAWFSLGKCLLADGKVKQAGKAFQHSIEVGRGWNEEPHAWIGVCKVSMVSGNWNLAEEALDRAHRIAPDITEIKTLHQNIQISKDSGKTPVDGC